MCDKQRYVIGKLKGLHSGSCPTCGMEILVVFGEEEKIKKLVDKYDQLTKEVNELLRDNVIQLNR